MSDLSCADGGRSRKAARAFLSGAVAAGLVAVLAAAAIDCGRRGGIPAAEEFNLLLITVDTLRADGLGCYGRAGAATPNMDGLAGRGVRFEDCVTPVPLTLPAHASIMTGRYPAAHGVRNNGRYALPEAETTLAEILRGRGWDTYAVVASFVLLGKFGLSQGFATYDDSLDSHVSDMNYLSEIPAPDVYLKFSRWLAGRGGSRFFAWVHFYDPHAPYAPPEDIAARFPPDLRGRYDAEIACVDRYVGKIVADLETAGLMDKTLIVIAGDHGEAFGEHLEYEHGVFAYQATLGVPLIFHGPALFPAAKAVASRVGLVDILPTVLDLCGIPAPPEVNGRSLRPSLLGRPDPEREPRVFCFESLYGQEELGWAPLTGIIRGSDKLISLPEPELYDLGRDPGEERNLFAARGGTAAELDDLLGRTMAGLAGSGRGSRRELSAEDEARLKSLGYISAFADRSAAAVDPKTGILAERRAKEILAGIRRGAIDQAERDLAGLEAEYPELKMPVLYDIRLGILSARGGNEEIVRLMDRAVAEFPGEGRFYLMGALASFRMGKLGEAEKRCRELLAVDPSFARANTLLAEISVRRGDLPGALERYKQALEVEPHNLGIRLKAAEVLVGQKKFTEALSFYDEVLGYEQVLRSPDLLAKIAAFQMRYGSPDTAERLLARVIDIKPDPKARFNCALVQARNGHLSEALDNLRKALSSPEGLTPEQAKMARDLVSTWTGQRIR